MLIEISPGVWLSEPELVERRVGDEEDIEAHPWVVQMPGVDRHFLTDEEYEALVGPARTQQELMGVFGKPTELPLMHVYGGNIP